MPEVQTLLTGIAMGESPRSHDDRLWFADRGAGEIIAVDVEGASQVVLRRQSVPLSIDWLPDGRLLLVSGGAVLQRVDVDLGCFDCMLGGEDGGTLFIVANGWPLPADMTAEGGRMGRVLSVEAPAAWTGWP